MREEQVDWKEEAFSTAREKDAREHDVEGESVEAWNIQASRAERGDMYHLMLFFCATAATWDIRALFLFGILTASMRFLWLIYTK